MRHNCMLAIIVLAGLLAAYSGPALAAPPTPSPDLPPATATPTPVPVTISTDCGENMDCFIQASTDCTTASVTSTLTINFFGLLSTVVSLYEIRGIEADRCLFYYRTEDAYVKASDEIIEQMTAEGHTDEEIAAAEQEATDSMQSQVGLGRTCSFDTPDLTAMLQRWADGSFSTEDWAVAQCTEFAR
ncbi:MAG: hypothetical protein M1370_12370 [Bacteroidetes bacterium]|nr:hypothetical protein [Bacteroidota bacterium]